MKLSLEELLKLKEENYEEFLKVVNSFNSEESPYYVKKYKNGIIDRISTFGHNLTQEGRNNMSKSMSDINLKNSEKFKERFLDMRKNISSEELSKFGKKGISKMKKEDRIKGASKVGKKNVESGHLERLRTKEHQKYASERSNSKKVICPDGHITSKPSSVNYCNKRGLNPKDCLEISLEKYSELLEEKNNNRLPNLFETAKIKKEKIYDSLPTEFTVKKASEILGDEFPNIGVYFKDKKRYEKIGYGKYRKIPLI